MPNAPRQKPDDTFEPWELDLIRHLVMDFLAERLPPTHVDRKDLYQECVLHWWSRRNRYEPGRGASQKTFLRKVVKAKLFDIGRGWNSIRRGADFRFLPLDTPISPDDLEGTTLAETLPAPEEVDSDIPTVMDRLRLTVHLSARQREIIAGVTAGMTKTALSTRLGISRDTLYKELKLIKRIFRDEGLADLLE